MSRHDADLTAPVGRESNGSRPLAGMRERFCRAYLDHFNATRALNEAGYAGKYPRHLSTRWMKSPDILARIGFLSEQCLKAVGVNHYRQVRELARIGFSDITNVKLDSSGNLDPALPSDVTATIKKFKRTVRSFGSQEQGTDGVEVVTEVELYDKLKALEALAKYQSLYPSEPGATADQPLHIVITREGA